MKIKCEFAGGLQILFDDETKLEAEIPEKSTIRDLILILKHKHVKRTPELFVIDNNNL